MRLTESAEFGAFCRIDGEPEWLDQTVTVRVFNVPPEIIAFIASPGTVAAGTPVNLLWTVRDADSCLIQPGDLDVPPGTGSLEVMPPATTVYSLICLRETVNRHAQAVVTVTP